MNFCRCTYDGYITDTSDCRIHGPKPAPAPRRTHMEHDWMSEYPREPGFSDDDDQICKRCNLIRHYWETNIPCGVRSHTSYYRRGLKGYEEVSSYADLVCCERDTD